MTGFTPPPVQPDLPPDAPSRQDDSDVQFMAKANLLVGWYKPFVTWLRGFIAWANTYTAEAAALQEEVTAKSDAANDAAHAAAGSAAAAAASANVAAAGSAGLTGASTSPLTIGVGLRTFTVPAGKNWSPGLGVRAWAAPGAFMAGPVVSYAGTTLVVDVDVTRGQGSYSSWQLGVHFPEPDEAALVFAVALS